MNLTICKIRGNRVATLSAVSAAALLTACSPTPTGEAAANPHASEPSPSATSQVHEIDISFRQAEVGDELAFWANLDQAPVPPADVALLHLPTVYHPSDEVAATGVYAVAPLGDYCIVALSTAGANTNAGRASVAVLTRYNLTIDSTSANLNPDEVAAEVDYWREPCTKGTYQLDYTEIVNGYPQTQA